MKGSFAAVLASAVSGVLAAPAPAAITARAELEPRATACATPVTLSGNPFASRKIYANPFYSSEVISAASAIADPALATAAAKVADVGTFMWM
jgi:cellulose 1,4-beta-cellobiosidase